MYADIVGSAESKSHAFVVMIHRQTNARVCCETDSQEFGEMYLALISINISIIASHEYLKCYNEAAKVLSISSYGNISINGYGNISISGYGNISISDYGNISISDCYCQDNKP